MGAARTDVAGLSVGTHADHIADITSLEACAKVANLAQSGHVEVRCKTTGNIVCSLKRTADMDAATLKQAIRETAGLAIEAQRLYLGEQELAHGTELPSELEGPLLLSCEVDPRTSNLGHFRAGLETFEALPQGAFTVVRKLASGILGDILQCRWDKRGESDEGAPVKKQRTDAEGEEYVAVKKLCTDKLQAIVGTETDERTLHMRPAREAPQAEDALAEIGVLRYLSRQTDLSPYILRMRGVFAEQGSVWLVTDFADGGDLFDVAASGAVPEDRLQRYSRQLFHAVAYLHRHNIGHRDISLENVLLKSDSVRLMDFGMSVSSHSASGVPLRFFRAVGKASYRAPEVYCPTSAKTWVTLPGDAEPGAAAMGETSAGQLCQVHVPETAKPGRGCMAEIYGYEAQAADIFSCGVSLFMLAWQCPPWSQARLSDPMFAFVHGKGSRGLEALLKHWRRSLLSEDAMSFVVQALHPNPSKRPTAAECMNSAWLAEC